MKRQGKIKVLLTGGLGNQLFKSIATIGLAESLGRLPEMDVTWFDYSFDRINTVTSRKYELGYFPNLEASFNKISIERFPRANQRKIQLVRRMPTQSRKFFGYYSENEIYEITEKSKNVKLIANFEHVNYLPSEEKMRVLIEPISEVTSWQHNQLNEIGNESFIGIHIRQGDYLKFPQIYNVLTPDYYTCAIESLHKKYRRLPLVLFSDQPQLALNWIDNKLNFSYIVQTLPEVSAAEAMFLLSKSTVVITAHSTFSWWAARIGTLRGTTEEVIIPKRFFADNTKKSDNLLVPGWLQI